MATQVIKVDRSGDFRKITLEAGQVLSSGGLVVFPTETVYGLAARADDPKAMARLREVKGRDVQQGFTVHLAHRQDAQKYVAKMPPLANRLIRKAWPGPLTILLEEKDPASALVMSERNGAGRDTIYYNGTVGLRCPDDAVCQGILESVDAPVVAASANLAGKPPPRTGAEVLQGLDGMFDLLIDAGQTRYSQASTIVRVTQGDYKVVREGVLDAGIIKRLALVHLLFVCTGNTCRSPMAAGLARKMLAERMGCDMQALKQHGVNVTSAGTSGGAGPASSGALRAMSQRGVDLSNHASTALTPVLIQQADHVFVMTQTHRDVVLDMAPWAKNKTSLLLVSQDVEDPVGRSDEVYDQCAQVIERGLRERLQEVSI